MAACWYGIARTATIDRAAAWAEIDDGGSAKIVTGVTEIGEGILTVLAQIAAHEMGVKPEHVVIGDNDTARAPEASHAGASRQTYMIGNAVGLASREARKRLVEVMAEVWDVDAEQIKTGNGEIWAENTNHRITMGEAVAIAKNRGVVPVGSATFGTDTTGLDPVDGSGRPWQAYVFGCQVAEVEVDTVTGEVQVLGIWAAHDVGRAVNPQGVEGQIEGGIVQALGQGLMEDYKLKDGHTCTSGFAKYILPTSLDVPRVNSIIIEDPDPIGPLGVKGVGEPAMVPTIPAIMNAIYDAVGVRITDLPATPEKVLMAIRAKERTRGRSGGACRGIRRHEKCMRSCVGWPQRHELRSRSRLHESNHKFGRKQAMRYHQATSLALLARFGCCLAAAMPAQAAGFPEKPVEMTVLFGGSAQTVGQVLADQMSKKLGSPVVAVARKGGGGAIGYTYVHGTAPDGYNIVWNSNSISTTHYCGHLPFDYKAFTPIARIGMELPVLAVRPKSGWKTLKDMAAAGKKSGHQTQGRGRRSRLIHAHCRGSAVQSARSSR